MNVYHKSLRDGNCLISPRGQSDRNRGQGASTDPGPIFHAAECKTKSRGPINEMAQRGHTKWGAHLARSTGSFVPLK